MNNNWLLIESQNINLQKTVLRSIRLQLQVTAIWYTNVKIYRFTSGKSTDVHIQNDTYASVKQSILTHKYSFRWVIKG